MKTATGYLQVDSLCRDVHCHRADRCSLDFSGSDCAVMIAVVLTQQENVPVTFLFVYAEVKWW